jgi:hypothetical protein
MNTCQFDNIILTSPTELIVQSYQYQLDQLQYQISDYFNDVVFFCCSDPQGERIGSGGGTINALKQFQSAFPSIDLSKTKTILIHSGGDSRRAPFYSIVGKAFLSLNCIVNTGNNEDEDVVVTPLLLLMQELSSFAMKCNLKENSLVITCSDVLLSLDCSRLDDSSCSFSTTDSITIVTMPTKATTAVNHGVLYNQELCSHLSDRSSSSPIALANVELYLQKPKLQELREKKIVFSGSTDKPHHFSSDVELALIDSGVIIFAGTAFSSLLSLTQHNLLIENPFLRFELYSELLYACHVAHDSLSSIESYIAKFTIDSVSYSSCYLHLLNLLYQTFSLYQLKLLCVPNGSFHHLGTTIELMQLFFSSSIATAQPDSFSSGLSLTTRNTVKSTVSASSCFNNPAFAVQEVSIDGDNNSTLRSAKPMMISIVSMNVPNSTFPSKVLYEYCWISDSMIVKKQSKVNGPKQYFFDSVELGLFSNLSTSISSHLLPFSQMMIQQIPVASPSQHENQLGYVLIILSINDNIKQEYSEATATVGGVSWQKFLTVRN